MPAEQDLCVSGDRLSISKLLEWSDWRGPLVGPRIPEQGLRNLINVRLLEGLRQGRGDQVDVRAHVTRVGNIHTKRQRCPYGWSAGEIPQGLVHDLLGERITSPDMHPEGEMGADATERCR